MLRVRNPWGEMNWTGNWKNSDPKWTPEAKRIMEMSRNGEDDGQFIMTLEAYIKIFGYTTFVYEPDHSQ